MASFKSHPFFYTSLLLIGAVAAGQAWLVFSQRSQAAKLATDIEAKQQELDAFARQNPFPSKDNVAAVESDRAQAEKTRGEIREVLRSSSETASQLAAAQVPASTTDAYFDIASYVERVRGAAQQAGIQLAADGQLGFSLYASTGPERELIAAVFKQRQYADYLMGVLIAARPRSIVSLQRERPLTPEQKQQVADALASGQPSPLGSASDGGDYFVIDPRTSARVPGFVDTTPFRFSFTGTTLALRSVLNELARFELPVVVRSVEVAPLNKGDAPPVRQTASPSNPFSAFGGNNSATSAAEAVKPLVEQTDSSFVVTVEFISLVDKNAPAETTAATNS
jgi:hypothetical protein